jgi:hypothetical protein
VTAASAAAQSFGRNKVHYDDFDFQILQTEHFDIYHYTAERDASREAGRLAERWYARLSHTLDHQFRQRQPIVLYASHAQFSETNVIPELLPEGVGGVTEHEKGRIVLPFVAGLGETDHVLGHELVHAFQRDILHDAGRSITALPLWFVEGMAEYLSVGRIDSNTAMWLRDAVEQDRLPSIDQLGDPRWFPYRYGQALWFYLASQYGEDVVVRSLKIKASGGAAGRLAAATGKDIATLSKGWHASLRQSFAHKTGAATAMSPAVLGAKKDDGRLNVGPSLSPDGRSLVFLSERDRYSIDVFVADALTGATHRKIVETAVDPHFDSLQFIESAGAWDQDGRRFALAALSQGQPVLTIIDVQTGSVERELAVRGVDQIFSPTWSPDGKQIAFSGMKGGFSDLYVIDCGSGAVRALTADAYADLQPAWSPDGRSLAFATDRFSSSTDTLTFGTFQLAVIDLASRAISALPSVAHAKNIDPHWSPDGKSLYFIADPLGVSNVYRLEVADSRLRRITDVTTGVSGVTALSPALSVAAHADRLAFSVYRHGGYQIHTIVPPHDAPADSTEVAAAEPPAPAAPSVVAESLPAFGVPDGRAFSTRPYHAGLSLNRVVQPYLSTGGGATGGFIRGGAALSFGDMLGDHQLQTALQVGKTLDDFVAQAAYLNVRSRWNWGFVGGQVPWLVAGTDSPLVPNTSTNTVTRESSVFRQLHREVSAVAVYPFSRSRRLEITGGVQSISFDREDTLSTYSSLTGQLLTTATGTTPAAPIATLFETSAALVYDSSVFGPTSPILGQRYRLSVAPTFGSISFATVIADYRKYVMPVRPLTLALRVMHAGRYGSGSDDLRLLPLAWTLRDVVRGYGDTGSNTSIGYLSATRLAVVNAELRVPVMELLGRRSAGLPIEALMFGDAGKFWTANALLPEMPTGLRSVGAGVRLNAAGLMVFELDAVRPFDRPERGWTFAFNLRPGF